MSLWMISTDFYHLLIVTGFCCHNTHNPLPALHLVRGFSPFMGMVGYHGNQPCCHDTGGGVAMLEN